MILNLLAAQIIQAQIVQVAQIAQQPQTLSAKHERDKTRCESQGHGQDDCENGEE